MQSSVQNFKSAFIIDDHPLFCDALSMTLSHVANIADIRTFANLGDSITALEDAARPDLIVLDLNLPDVDGLDGVVRLLNLVDAPVIVVSSMSDNRVISSTLRAGASGFVPKHSKREVFSAAIDTLRRGQKFTPDGFVEENAESDMNIPDALSRLSTLTNQQARILELICQGKLNKQIAFDLSIAETTVKAHVTAIMRKLGVQSRTQAVLLAKETSFANVLHEGAGPA